MRPLVLATLFLALAGCGLKGDLYLPDRAATPTGTSPPATDGEKTARDAKPAAP